MGCSYMKVVYMCRPEFENGGLKERGPSLKIGGGGGAFRTGVRFTKVFMT